MKRTFDQTTKDGANPDEEGKGGGGGVGGEGGAEEG